MSGPLDPPTVTISALVPSYNSQDHLAETLEAILSQTWPPDEVIVADDGSTDDTTVVARAFTPDVTVLCLDHAGTAMNRQRALDASTGTLIAACDADDLWLPSKLETQLEVLAARPDLHAIGCLVDEFLSPEADEVHMPGRGLRRRARALGASALMIRRSFLESAGGYLAQNELGESVEWYAKALSAGLNADVVPEVLVRRRIHANNTSRSFNDDKSSYLRIMREHLARRRRGDP